MFAKYAPKNTNELSIGNMTRNQERTINPLLHIQFSKCVQITINIMEKTK